MSHRISLNRLEEIKEVASFRRGGFGNDDRHTIYKIMRFEFADAGVSGDGSSWILRQDDYGKDVETWIEKAKETGQEDLMFFFEKMKSEMKRYGQVLIRFS